MCGVIGVIGREGPVISEIVDGLQLIQHRGQDAAGAATFDGRVFHLHRSMGLVREAFSGENLERYAGSMGIGHVRYPTIGGGGVEDAQPFHVNSPYGLAMAHNGNLTNFKGLKEELNDECHRYVGSSCDVEVILNVYADELSKRMTKGVDALFDAVAPTFERCRGSYSCVTLVAGQGLLAFRDPNGIKPLIWGKKETPEGTRYMFASESCVFSPLGYEPIANVRPGEAIFVPLGGGEPIHRQVAPDRGTLCIFEFIYFARPDSEIDGISVYKARLRLGAALAKRWRESHPDVDTVMPVPDSSRPAAHEMGYELRKPVREDLLKNRYIGRTFIMAGQEARKRGIRFKLAPVRLEIEGKRILLVDDSIVRGTTSRAIIRMVRKTGAAEVHMASSCPPLRFPCVYGVDMSTKREFIAQDRDVDGIRAEIEADSLLYQDKDDMVEAVRVPDSDDQRTFCMACMDGVYPTGDITPEVLDEIESERVASGTA